jgi:hypothetical protein
MDQTISVPQAGVRLGESYNQVMRRVLVGELKGWQDERGRWRVLDADVARLKHHRDAQRALATAGVSGSGPV